MRQNYGGPKLPVELRTQFEDPANNSRRIGSRNVPLNRKEQRKADRVEKKRQNKPVQKRFQTNRYQARPTPRKVEAQEEEDEDDEEIDWDNVSGDETPPPTMEAPTQKPPKSILKKTLPPQENASPPSPKVSRAMKDKLAQDDAEIAALEKRLGMKRNKKSKGNGDGLDDIFGDLGDLGDFSDEDDLDHLSSKRKRTEDVDWLASKRQKALGNTLADDSEDDSDIISGEESYDQASGAEDTDPDAAESVDEMDDGPELDSDGFDDDDDDDEQVSDVEAAEPQPRVRENPYVAPVSADASQPTKYVPPALRAPPSSDAEALSRLRRQIQGLFNRLSEANLLTILRDIETIYQNNPRGYVNNTLVDLLIGMLADPSALLDTFLNLHAGFIAAIYKVIGPDFGAQMVERIVAEIDKQYFVNKDGPGKQTTNLISAIAELYTFQVVGSNIVFDYIRFFLKELSEINTELLLRIVRAAGPQLRQDDPTALKDIVVLLQKSVAQVGQNNLPVRTKFMIETINDLKNNRMKTGTAASALSREHTTRIKKQLGTLNTRNLKATEPLRVGLSDIRDTEKKGKWWLVGASWRNETSIEHKSEDQPKATRQSETIDDEEDDGEVDLVQLAREHRMNTDIRRAIFISIMSATDFKDAQIRLNKLNLKKAQEAEIPRVLVHCAGAEETYNPFYTVLARKVCTDHRSRKSFQFALWDIFKSLGEKEDGGDDSDGDEEDTKSGKAIRKLVNQGKMYGTLIAKKALPMTSLKNLNFPYLQPATRTFVEVLLVTTIIESQKGDKSKRNERAIREIFIEVDQAPEMIAGLQWFLKKVVKSTDIVESKEKETVKWACSSVMDMFSRILATTTLQDE